jgi:hypothetical protein
MPIQWGDSGRSSVGALKRIVCTLPKPQETYLATPITLPTTEPATGQVIFTVQDTDMPSFQPFPLPCHYSAFVNISGKTGAVGAVISYRVLKNGVSIAQATSGATVATQYWMQSHQRWYDVQPGDVLEVRLWTAQTDYVLDYYSMYVLALDIDPVKRGTILANWTATTTTPKLTGAGMPQAISAATTGSFLTRPYSNGSNLGLNGTNAFNIVQFLTTFPMFPPQYGGNGGATTTYNNAAGRQFLYQAALVFLTYREVTL